MRRKLNVKLLFGTLAGLLIVSAAAYALHGYQMKQNAYRLLERGDQAFAAKDYAKAELRYAEYLKFVPHDSETARKYAQALDFSASSFDDRVQLVVLMEQVLRVKPDQDEFRMRLVHNLIALGRYAEATEHVNKLLATATDKAEVHHLRGWCLEAQKKYGEAVQAFEKAFEVNPKKIESYALAAEVLQERNQPAAALKALDEMVRANPDSYQAYLVRARFQRQQNSEAAAESDLDMAHKLKPNQPEVILEIADAARVRGKWDEAVPLLKNAIKRTPDFAAFYRLLAAGEIQRGQRDAAIAYLQDGLRHAPKSSDLAVMLIDLLIDQQQYAEARAKIQELTKTELRPTLPNYLTARLRIADNEWSEAIKLLNGVRQELGPKSAWTSRVHALLGVCYRQIGDQEQALQAFRRAVRDEPTWTVAIAGLGMALLDNGRIEEASQTLEPLRVSKDLPAGYWGLLARSRLARQLRLPAEQRHWEDVEEALTAAAKAEPKSIEVSAVRAAMLAAQRDFGAAKALLEKTKAAHPDDRAVWCALADLQARQNHFDEAEKILDAAADPKLFGDRLDLRLAKARLWGQRGNDEDKAKLARLGAHLPSTYSVEERSQLRRALADIWFRFGAWDRASALWSEVAADLPRDVRSRFALVEIALQNNDAAAAQRWLAELRTLEGEQGSLWRYAEAAILVRQAHGSRGKLEVARKKLQELEPMHKDWSRLPLLSATISELEGKYQQAITEYTRALEMGETQPGTLGRLLELLLQRREFGKAEAELAKYEQKLPLTQELARLGAEVALGARDKRSAQLALRRAELAVTLPSRDYRDYLWLAPIYRDAGEPAKAAQMLRTSLDLAGHAPDAWIAWMEHLAQTDQRSLALMELDRLKQVLPANRQPLTIARCYEALRMPEQAAAAYQAALKARPGDFVALAYAADFQRRADQSALAQKLYEQLLDPDLAAPAEYVVQARRHLAVLLATHGAAARQKALALLSDNTKSRGDTIADERIRLFIQSQDERLRDDALNQFQETLRRQTPTPDERLLLAQLLEATNNLGQARAQLAVVVDENPTKPQYLVRYARLLIRAGDLEEAGRLLARLETLEPNSERLRALKTALVRAKK